MSKIKISELRNIIREELINTIVEFKTKDMPNGATWKVAGTGWGAKNTTGIANYWYTKDEEANKKKASEWAKSSTPKTDAKKES